MKEPNWIAERALVLLHGEGLATHGGASGLRDRGLLESALAGPQNVFLYGGYEDFFDLAACYAYGMAKNHPFVDGNKRAGFLCAGLFLLLNGLRLEVDQVTATEMVVRLAGGEMSEAEYAAFLRANSKPR